MAGTYLKLADNAETTLNGNITDVADSIAVTSVATLPSTFPYLLTIWDENIYPDPSDDPNMEQVLVGGATANTLTSVTRGYGGTSGVAHADTDRIALLITVEVFTDATYGVQTVLDAHLDDTSNPHNTTAIQVPIVDSGSIITATEVEGALQENRTAIDLNTAKVTNATHTGDVTGDEELTIASDAVTNAKLADVATSTIKGRATASTGDPEDLTAAQVRTIINVEDGSTADQIASEVPNTPSGTISATDVQAAINELDTEKETPTGAQDKVDTHATDTSTHGVGEVVGTSESQTLTTKTIDADSNTITNIDNNEIKAAAGIVESKLTLDYGTSSLNSSITDIQNDIDYPTTVKQKDITDTGEDGGVEGGVFNGDFEYGEGSVNSSHAGWIGSESYGWYIHYDDVNSTVSIENSKLKIVNTTGTGINSAIGNLPANIPTDEELGRYGIPCISSTTYRLSLKLKSTAIGGAYTIVHLYENAATRVATAPELVDAADVDEYHEIIFTTGASDKYLRVELASGGENVTAWFDDIKLEQIDTQAVNTQVVTPASVSIEGVTTTDNVDQSQPTGTSNLGAMVVSADTQGQTFTPSEEKHTKVDIYTLKSGDAGDITVTVYKWDTDYATTISGSVLASVTVLAADVVNSGYTEFNLPCILETGEVYLYHGTSTAVDAATNYTKFRGESLSDLYSGGSAWDTGVVENYDLNFKQYFAKHTESPVIEANGSSLDLTGVKLLTGATITVNADGSGKYKLDVPLLADSNDIVRALSSIYSSTGGGYAIGWLMDGWILDSTNGRLQATNGATERNLVWKVDTLNPLKSIRGFVDSAYGTRLRMSADGESWVDIITMNNVGSLSTRTSFQTDAMNGYSTIYVEFGKDSTDTWCELYGLEVVADIDCTNVQLPSFVPSSEVQTETSDLVLNPIDISEGQLWELNDDLTGWQSRTITMLSDEATYESQAVSANTIYVYDTNGTTPWTWDTRNGLVPPSDRTTGAVMAKFLVGDNQIKTSVNDGSMKANVNLSWDEESLRAALNRVTALANMPSPHVIVIDDEPAIDVQSAPTGASAETGYTNNVTSLRQTTAGVAAIAYIGLTPADSRFTQWLDVVVECDDGDGVLQARLYTDDGTLVEEYADIGSDGIIDISNPAYKYSNERLILQISASTETTSTEWSVTRIKWYYQNG